SLAFYLIHQPVLIACVWLFSLASPPAALQNQEQGFLRSCAVACEESRDSSFCAAYCGCMLDALSKDGTLERMSGGQQSPELRAHVTEMAGMCTAKTDDMVTGGGMQ